MFMKISFGIPKKSSALKPRAEARDELHVAGIAAGFPHAVCGAPESARPNEADVGRELPPHFVTKPQADLKIGQAGAQLPCAIGLAVEIGLTFRLQNQPLCEEQLVFRLEPHGRAPLLTDIERRLGGEPIGRESLDANRRPSARRTPAEILASPRLHTPPTRERVVPEQIGAGVLRRATDALAFCSQPDLVVVAAVPRFRIPHRGIALGGVAPLELIKEHSRRTRRVVHLHHRRDRKSTRLNSSHSQNSYAVFCLKKK